MRILKKKDYSFEEDKVTGNPYEEGTGDYLVWQEAYLAGKIDGSFEIMMAYLNKKIGGKE